ncbi:hypothetical protein [Planococcus lenghuensis]|uniref:Uncharacterized protein n=1 Tax=Planococcus lenghuensis TaxID=2213202 RepID=A0A1Q2L6B4_9BACL|nr:hypothetical protein [Planococcus lenghuensis]AQQ55627.1 hypothetical protein B0X71_20855 [Planococcus lenghuensis]
MTTMTIDTNRLLTAYNRDVQRFMMNGHTCTSAKKRRLLDTIEQAVLQAGKSFDRLFPAKTKRQAVLDEIVFLLSASGICKVSAGTLADKTGASPRTVASAVKNIKETGQILVGGLADGKNKYIFVLKSHENFPVIMKEVFFIDDAQQNAQQIAYQENPETLGAVSPEGEKSVSNHLNEFNSKQEKTNIQQMVEDDLNNLKETPVEMRQKLEKYTQNKYQLMLFDEIQAFPFPEPVKNAAGILALRAGMDCDQKQVLKSMKILNKIGLNLIDGVEIRSIPAIFSAALANQQPKELEPVIKPARRTPKVAFYDWLTDRS